MSWSEMEKELVKEHGVPTAILRKIRLVSELQSLLGQYRTADDMAITNSGQPGSNVKSSKDSTDACNAKDGHHILESKHSDEKEALQSLLLVGPRARSGSIETTATLDAQLSNVTPTIPERKLSSTDIEPCVSIHSFNPFPQCVSPKRVSTASILAHCKAEKSRSKPTLQTLQQERLSSGSRIGIYSPNSRKQLLSKFQKKRENRVWNRNIRYTCRKSFAHARVRVKGRFVKKTEGDESSYLLPDGRKRSNSVCSISSIGPINDEQRTRSNSE